MVISEKRVRHGRILPRTHRDRPKPTRRRDL